VVSPRRKPALGEYLVKLYILLREGHPVVGARLAERMGVSPPAVTQAIRRMARDGLVTTSKSEGIRLTPQGRAMAEATMRRHFLIEWMLVEFLGMDWAEIHPEADQLEHSLSPHLEEKLYVRLGRPTTCPHGNPFPGSPDEKRLIKARSLWDAADGEEVEVLRITEDAEEDPKLMRFLVKHEVKPGAVLRLSHRDAQADTVVVRRGGKALSLPTAWARKVRVSGP
jgi:DtxR family Mn-dependent transcriptional regulator